MKCTVDDIMVYLLRLTRNIQDGDVPRAILAVLMELGFQPQSDGFCHLRKAIYVKYRNPDQRIGAVYLTVGQRNNADTGSDQVEQTIRAAIEAAWKNRDEEIWNYFFPRRQSETTKRPSNGEFIAQMGCIMELWSGRSGEECLAEK